VTELGKMFTNSCVENPKVCADGKNKPAEQSFHAIPTAVIDRVGNDLAFPKDWA
jgi:hypothetical protein